MSYVNYEYYSKSFKGSLSEDEFNSLISKACDIIESYIMSLIPSDRVKMLDEYEFDLSKCICYELELLQAVGGNSVINGSSSVLSIESVETENFRYKYGKEDKYEMLGSIPISPFVSNYIKTMLNKNGYFNKLIY